MTPSALRALLGQTLIPNVPGQGPATARYRVLGFGDSEVRVISGTDKRSAIPIDVLDGALIRGELVIEVVRTK